MNRVFVLLYLMILGANLNTLQARKTVKLSPEEKATIKMLKSSYKPKSVDLKIGDDGFKYYELISKEGIHFVADSIGTVIIDPKYEYSNIIYVPQAETSKKDYFPQYMGRY